VVVRVGQFKKKTLRNGMMNGHRTWVVMVVVWDTFPKCRLLIFNQFFSVSDLFET